MMWSPNCNLMTSQLAVDYSSLDLVSLGYATVFQNIVCTHEESHSGGTAVAQRLRFTLLSHCRPH